MITFETRVASCTCEGMIKFPTNDNYTTGNGTCTISTTYILKSGHVTTAYVRLAEGYDKVFDHNILAADVIHRNFRARTFISYSRVNVLFWFFYLSTSFFVVKRKSSLEALGPDEMRQCNYVIIQT